MSTSSGLRFLRPYLYKELSVPTNRAYLRFFSDTRCLNKKVRRSNPESDGHTVTKEKEKGAKLKRNTNDRLTKLEYADALKWPRIQNDVKPMTVKEYATKYGHLAPGSSVKSDAVLVRGRLMSFRSAGGKLVFLDIVQDGHLVQGIANQGHLDAFGNVSKTQFKAFAQRLQRGDFISLHGTPSVTAKSKGDLSVFCLELPRVLAPSISLLPKSIEDSETRIRNRHVDMLIRHQASDTVRARSHIIQCIRNFLLKDQFLEVQTPIIADSAGGAIARPFTTVATEFSDKQLALRVAPEIWLKRLIIGGMDRVFEIGPAFRNEGLDATHNPEFTTCEFYKAFADLNDLMTMTEEMVSGIASLVKTLRQHPLTTLPDPDTWLGTAPFKRIEFIPAIEEALGETLPNLNGEKATEELLALCKKHSLEISASLTLPRVLDKLASIYIEPHCDNPTYIIHHPACMAPLAKSFVDNKTGQLVSARAELFIQKREMANMYEEENSPIQQRENFMQQAKFKDAENKAVIDESYLEALEWGLPPTGGWGCGIDRMVMLFAGANRISDVLSFGSLRNVVNLGSPAPRASGVAKKLAELASQGPKSAVELKLAKKKKKRQGHKAASAPAVAMADKVTSESVAPQKESLPEANEAVPSEKPSEKASAAM